MWKDFKTNPPHNHSDRCGECDPEWGFILYRYLDRGSGGHWNERRLRPFISEFPTHFENGVWVEYERHMKTSPYKEDWIEVIAWLPIEDALTYLKGKAQTRFLVAKERDVNALRREARKRKG